MIKHGGYVYILTNAGNTVLYTGVTSTLLNGLKRTGTMSTLVALQATIIAASLFTMRISAASRMRYKKRKG